METRLTMNNSQAIQEQVKNLVVNTEMANLKHFIKNQVKLACIYRGIANKTDEEIGLIAEMTTSEIKRRFAYLQISQVESYFRQNKYGAEFSNTVCPDALIQCLEKSNATYEQKCNKHLQDRANELPQHTQTKEERKEEAKRILQKDYNYWLKDGQVYNFKDWNYYYITTVLNYKHSLKECKYLLGKAIAQTNEYIQQKNKWRYRSLNSLLKDLELMHGKDYKTQRRINFRREYVRLFFKKVKNGEYQRWKSTQNL